MTLRSGRLSRLRFLPAFLLLAGGLHAQVCSNLTTVGRYVFTCDGYLSPAPNSSLVPARQLGTVTGDENGTFKGSGTMMLGGTTLVQSVVGTMKLNKDCTGTITYTTSVYGQPGPPLDITFVVSEQGNRIDGLVVDMGTVVSCVLHRISNADVPSVLASAATKEGDRVASQPRGESAAARKPTERGESAVVARR